METQDKRRNHLRIYVANIIAIIHHFLILAQTFTGQPWKSLKDLATSLPQLDAILKTIPQVELPRLKTSDKAMYLQKIAQGEVKSIIDKKDSNFSPGEDEICKIWIILDHSKTTSPVTLEILTNLINRSFKEGIFPIILKTAKVIPLHKSGSRSKKKNYRPSSLLIVWIRIFEKAMFNIIYDLIEKFQLLYCKTLWFSKTA